MWKGNKIDWQGVNEKLAGLTPFFKKNRYFLIILLAGMMLLYVGSPRDKPQETAKQPADTQSEQNAFDLASFQQQLKTQLAMIDGAGRVELMLSLGATEETVYASNIRQSTTGDSDETYENTLSVLQDGSYGEQPVKVKSTCPTFRGAVVLCDGADNISVRLAVTEAVGTVCGLGADKITVLKMQG